MFSYLFSFLTTHHRAKVRLTEFPRVPFSLFPFQTLLFSRSVEAYEGFVFTSVVNTLVFENHFFFSRSSLQSRAMSIFRARLLAFMIFYLVARLVEVVFSHSRCRNSISSVYFY